MQRRYALTQVKPPAKEPLTAEEVKLHLGVEHADHDPMLAHQIAAARREAETFMGRALLTQIWAMELDGFPPWTLEVPRPPLIAVDSINYLDIAGATQTLDAAHYRVDIKRAPGRVTPAYGERWPATRAVINAVTVQFTAGYGAAQKDVPEDIRQALLLIVGRHYAHREDVRDGMPAAELPLGAHHLLAPYRVVRV